MIVSIAHLRTGRVPGPCSHLAQFQVALHVRQGLHERLITRFLLRRGRLAPPARPAPGVQGRSGDSDPAADGSPSRGSCATLAAALSRVHWRYWVYHRHFSLEGNAQR
jgi:hypothetical protein